MKRGVFLLVIVVLISGSFILASGDDASAPSYNKTYLKFNGETDMVTVEDDDSFEFLESFTVALWANVTPTSVNEELISKYSTSNNNREWILRITNTGRFKFYRSTDGITTKSAATDQSYDDSLWHFFVAYYDSSTSRIYTSVDNVAGDDNPSSGSTFSGNADLKIGVQQTSKFFAGSIDDVRIYDSVISPIQFSRIYDESVYGNDFGKGIPSLVFHRIRYPSDSNTDISVEDFSEYMSWLNESGYETVTYDDYYKWRNGEFTMPEKPVILTFDDARITVWTEAKPVMDLYGYVGVVGVIINQADTSGNLNWEQITTMHNEGWQIAAHSLDHVRMSTLSKAERITVFQGTKNSIETILGITPSYWVYPFNDNNAIIDGECAEYYTMCSGFGGNLDTESAYLFKKANLTHEVSSPVGLRRATVRNYSTLSEFMNYVEYDKGEVLHLKLNEGGGNIAFDSSGNGNDGVITGATWINEEFIENNTESPNDPPSDNDCEWEKVNQGYDLIFDDGDGSQIKSILRIPLDVPYDEVRVLSGRALVSCDSIQGQQGSCIFYVNENVCAQIVSPSTSQYVEFSESCIDSFRDGGNDITELIGDHKFEYNDFQLEMEIKPANC